MPGKKPAAIALAENDGQFGVKVAEPVLKPASEVANEEGGEESDVVVAEAFVGEFVAEVEDVKVNVDDGEMDEVAVE